MEAIRKLIAETERWLGNHRAAARGMEAAACQIRLKALRDALAALEAET